MRDFEGKVAVVTGGASGIGRALADRFASEGMKVVLADIREDTLTATVNEFKAREFDAIGVIANVSDSDSVDNLARQALDAYGAIHIVCNNAGVVADGDLGAPADGSLGPRMWDQSLDDWRWTFDVNVWGVLHGIRTFVPIMLAQDDEGHIINTASIAGLISGAGPAIYGASKHTVVRISESLHLQLAQIDSKVKTSVLCPSFVQTDLHDSFRTRPAELGGDADPSAAAVASREVVDGLLRAGTPVEEIAELVLTAVQDEQFYILPHEALDIAIRSRMENILERRNPALPSR
jgi:NAD(P)-dependent dehydrogenase (short-subunit alcohol dehydrogenase family)